MNKVILYGLVLFSTLSCNKKIKAKKGGIDIISNVYFNASKGLENMQSYHISKLNYSNDSIIELIPNPVVPLLNKNIYFIKDSFAFILENEKINLNNISEKSKISIYKKPNGAVFSKNYIPNYIHKRNISDTILFGKKYKRFEINSSKSFNRFYVYETDTILPYSLYPHAEKDYNGRIERIDTYDKENDVFVSLQLLPRKKWDFEADEIFNYNRYIKNNTQK